MRKAGDVCFAEVCRDSEGIAFTLYFWQLIISVICLNLCVVQNPIHSPCNHTIEKLYICYMS